MPKAKWKAYLGIDPGKQGGWAALYPDKTVEVGRTPYKKPETLDEDDPKYPPGTGYQMKEMLLLCRSFQNKCLHGFGQLLQPIVLLEMQRPRMVQGRRVNLWGVQETGVGLGMWMMALAAARLPEPLWLIPSQWKLCYVPEKADKMVSVLKARELYPKASLPFKADNGPAEALLMADWQARFDRGEETPMVEQHRKRRKGA